MKSTERIFFFFREMAKNSSNQRDYLAIAIANSKDGMVFYVKQSIRQIICTKNPYKLAKIYGKIVQFTWKQF